MELLTYAQVADYMDLNVDDLKKIIEKQKISTYELNSKIYLSDDSIKEIEDYATQLLFDLEINENKDSGKYDKRNKLNDLTGKEWMPETKSYWFQKGLGKNNPEARIEKMHPAPFSFQDIERLIKFFTKKDEVVLDPFLGVGSTLKAAALTGRNGIGIELTSRWVELSKERLEKEVGKGTSDKFTIINGDSSKELKKLNDESVDFVVTSPPYWNILHKKDQKIIKQRVINGLETQYSEDDNDLGNVDDYNKFLEMLVNKFIFESARVLKNKKYFALIVSDFRHKSKFVSFHSDLINKIDGVKQKGYKLDLQGVKVLIQNHKSLHPYGYPFAYVENIHHQYILIFRKELI
ncbi:hypothetical protein LNP09_06075 [Apilactobacillus kunkeei]|uniref:DNA methyltransferase n=1 Tax=Apilactobacillus kunkeei TaxID=148814 RepID=UPI00200A9B76|nr:DNA methyltransferase [Apilactobacillus kunkeei]MCK8620520.1 hypothetical protein [Apilactobacillus kunkeei]